MNPIVWSCGMGRNSIAMAVGMVERGLSYDLALFADTGGADQKHGERTATYAYLPILQAYLAAHGLPPVMRVWKKNADNSPAPSLYDDCMTRRELPSVAYGYKSCSDQWKIRPQRRVVKQWQPAIDAWARGEKVTFLVGFDAGEAHRVMDYGTTKYVSRYPLVEWGWDREDCEAEILRAGLPMPPKSSCFFCPNMKPHEIKDLADNEPDHAEAALAMERNAVLTTVKGLGRSFAWANVMQANKEQIKMFPDHQDMPCACIG